MNKLARLFHKSLRLNKNDDGYKVKNTKKNK